MASSKRVIIVGGGIGGMTAALALLKRGIDVDLYEQSSRLREVGAGIQLSANGTRVLYALGLKEALAQSQVIPERRELRHWSTGETWTWFELGTASVQRYGTPHIMLHRSDLHGVLSNAVGSVKSDAISLGRKCVAVSQTSEHAQLLFEDGTGAQAPFAIGADGIHSNVRAALFGPSNPVFTGCVAWRGLVPMERLPKHMQRMVGTNWLGPHGFVLHYPVRRGELMNFVPVIERDDWQIESWVSEGTRNELADDFRGWHSDVHAIIANIETPFKWALMVRESMESWSAGRVTLLGDACHPTLPFLGQGGVMSIEDGYVLAACLEKYFGDPSRAFARYEEVRRDRTAMVVRKAHENRAMAFEPRLDDKNAVAEAIARDWLQVRLKERLDWLYSYDATAIEI
jgi:salicylate hydroxylase